MNRFAVLDGLKKIKDEFTKITTGFDKVETEIDDISDRVDTIITTPIDGAGSAQELVDARKGEATLGDKIDAMDAERTAHLAESASKHITESGSNTNGSYIKFDDGTMICRQLIDLPSAAITTAKGAVFYSSVNNNWVFPATFISEPVVAGNSRFYDTDFVWFNNATTIQTNYRPGSYTSKTANAKLGLIAIGRWKA